MEFEFRLCCSFAGFFFTIYLECQDTNISDFYIWLLFAHMHVNVESMILHVCMYVRKCMPSSPFSVCLCSREESPSMSQRLSPNYPTRWWMVEVWDWSFSGGGVQKTKRVNDWVGEGGWGGWGPCKTIPLTLGHSQTQEMLDLTPWEMSTAAQLC